MHDQCVVLRYTLFFLTTITILKAQKSSEWLPFRIDDQTYTDDFQRDRFYSMNQNSTIEGFYPVRRSLLDRQTTFSLEATAKAHIPVTPSYIIVAPRVVRPAQIVTISVTILRKSWDPIRVKALISDDRKGIASAEDSFMVGVPGTLEMLIPNNVRNGTYRLVIEGKMTTGERKFYNITELIYEQKAVSILIQLDRPTYRHETVVQFRCIPIYPDLSGYFHTIDAYILGPSGHILRKWENHQTTAGILSLEV